MTSARIRIRLGPLAVHGPVTLVDADGHELFIEEGRSVALCRCGHSATKPFCDSSHKRVGFESRPCLLDTDEGRSATKPAGGPQT